MRINFRRDVSASNMVVENVSGFSENGFSVRMLEYNDIRNLLGFGYENINGKINLLYDISSKQAMSAVLETEKISYDMLCGFIASLNSLVDTLGEYLLDADNVMLKTECIFMDLSAGKYSYCYNPCYNGDFSLELGMIFDELLSAVNYEEPETVKLAYSLHRECHKENFTVAAMAGLLPDRAGKFPEEKKPGAPDEPDMEAVKTEAERVFEKTFAEPAQEKKKHAAFSPSPASGEAPESPGVLKKVRLYLKGKSISEVVEDIDNGQIVRKVKESAPLPVYKTDAGKTAVLVNEPFAYAAEADRELSFDEVLISAENFRAAPPAQEQGIPEGINRKLVGINRQQGEIIEIDRYPFTLGRLENLVDRQLSSAAVSEMHCRLYENGKKEGGYYFEDLNSGSGTFINNIRLDPYKKMPLRPGDIVRIADEEYCFR